MCLLFLPACLSSVYTWDGMSLFICVVRGFSHLFLFLRAVIQVQTILRPVRFSLFSRLISHQTVFSSHNKSAVSAFQPAYKLKRLGVDHKSAICNCVKPGQLAKKFIVF
uniref:Uncharacterized protein n=1 Tax=Setaria viridis TaxID=4556 RepID=A0A4U6VKE5_SETVI|nr:hypothetical protein SEVIR_3G344400v2 [Setaria viridis]